MHQSVCVFCGSSPGATPSYRDAARELGALLLTFLDHAVEERFVPSGHRRLVVVSDAPADLLDKLDRAEAPAFPKWVDRSTT